MGQDSKSKAYRCYVSSRKIVVVSRDLKFTDDSIAKRETGREAQETNSSNGRFRRWSEDFGMSNGGV